MTKASANEVISPTGESGSALVVGTGLVLAVLLVGVGGVLVRNPALSAVVARPGPGAATAPKTATVSHLVGSGTTTTALATTTSTTATTTPSRPVTAATAPATLLAPARPAVTTDCSVALGYLAAHQAPGFIDYCNDGSAFGHYGYTCWNRAGVCPDGARVIHIACPAPFVYMNEAHNSWTLIGEGSGIDPFGQGTRSEQAFCNAHR